MLQRWLSEHGIDKDVVVGVARSPDFRAHAWLEGETVDEQFQELMRLPAPVGMKSTGRAHQRAEMRRRPAEPSCEGG